MNILIDTNAFIWFITSDTLLSRKNSEIIQDPSNTVYVSVASLWEMGIKYSLGKLESNLSGFEIVFDEIEKNTFDILQIKPDHIRFVASLPMHHRDPFDRMIVAQALTENISIISSDRKFDDYGVKRLWK